MAREQWKSEWGFLMAAVGSAIGLGNIWRFSYLAYEHGGGAFLIPYLTALLTAGIPLLILEYAIGHERIGSAPLAYAKIGRRWEWLGWWAVCLTLFGIMLYYSVVIAWCLDYFFYSFRLAWGDNPNAFFFKRFLQVSDSPADLGEIRTPILYGLIAVWFSSWWIVYRGVQRGIELASKILMPTLLGLTAVLVFWSLTLDGALTGLKAYVTPDFSKLANPKVWIDAYSQIFFTLSLGFGIMIAYASYLPDKAEITGNALLTAFINCGYSLFAGIAVFAVLGFMASAEGKPLAEVVTKSIGLAFVAYPKAMSLMPGGNLFGAVFFLCLVVAGLSSAVSIIEAFISAVADKFGAPRGPLVTVVCILGFLGSIVFATRAGLLWLDIVDHFLTHYGLVLVGVLECLVIGWCFRLPLLREHVNRISSVHLGAYWDGLIKFFVPLVLLVILAGDLYQDITEPYGGYSWVALILIGRDWLLANLALAFVLANRPWRTENHRRPGRRLA
ncbi:neurotransmitter:Na+ symporter, NSS family [Methylomarinovum tepidoasis]|uniref:Neurotransmitter:Na+ symporter, NSS family n=1 Tax=Methylomarinovum tepidoasis TaxID=2840183 RepID=A0AAU9BYN5_9GAMM|nr:sodium-dependent transporter [Methylomarinovum sp. IN45]BCX88865.1 neurotransmitter:Na+ symporter, NSS family [Methylomarinovum sp. IN45]